jgi:inosine-uridine nucleoside N-ribohydrolase
MRMASPRLSYWVTLQLMTWKVAAVLLAVSAGWAATPVRIIFDTDMGNDVDDVIALASLHALESRGESRLLAVTISKDNALAVPFISLFNQYYGRPDIPIGMVRSGKTPEDGNFLKAVTAKPYPRKITGTEGVPEAVALLRRVLAAQPDGSVTIVQVGFSTNLARLLDSPPDQVSPLAGRDLAARKVALLVLMAGRFPTGPAEYNVKIDVPAAQKLVSDWPGRIVTSGWEVGAAVAYDPKRLTSDFAYTATHPLVDAYRAYRPMPYEEPLWDPSAVLYAVRPLAAYFSLSPPGALQVDDKGVTTLAESAAGRHAYIVVNDAQRAAMREAISGLMSEPPRTAAGTIVK